MTTHAKYFSPSKASGWMACPGKPTLEAPHPDTSSAAADEGTLAHWVAGWALEENQDAITHFELFGGQHDCPDVPATLRVTEDMCRYVQVYLDAVRRSIDQNPGELMVEKRVTFQEALGVEEEAGGTADAIILRDDGFEVHDLKFGANPNNRVDAMYNDQLMLYALGVVEEYGHLADFKSVKLVIHQPRLDHQDEWVVHIDELAEYRDVAWLAAKQVTLAKEDAEAGLADWDKKYLKPGEEQCKWCKAKATCPALRAVIEEAIAEVPGELLALNEAMKLTKLAEDWAKAVRAAVETALLEGKQLADFKLVEGRRGARSWINSGMVEALLKERFRLKVDQMYDMTLISPTTAEKLLGDSKRRWSQLEKLIEQRPGKPSVAPMTDKRPAISSGATVDGMTAIEDDDSLSSLM